MLRIMKNLENVLKKEKKFSPELTVYYISQLIDALIYLRDNNIIHRDLKLANLFLKEDGSIKLGDFGLACKHDNPNRKRKSICGTPNYIAPEMLSGDGHSFQVDVWAVGILLFAMLIGKPPFETTNMKMTYNRIQSCMYVFPPDKPISLSAKMLIQKILNKNPTKRPTLEEVLESEFFNENQGYDTKTGTKIETKPPSTKNIPIADKKQSAPLAQHPTPRPDPTPPQSLVPSPMVPKREVEKMPTEGPELKKAMMKKALEEELVNSPEKAKSPLERQQFYKKLMNNEFKDKQVPTLQTMKSLDPISSMEIRKTASAMPANQFSSASKMERKIFERERDDQLGRSSQEISKDLKFGNGEPVYASDSPGDKKGAGEESGTKNQRTGFQSVPQSTKNILLKNDVKASARDIDLGSSHKPSIEQSNIQSDSPGKEFEPAILKRIIHHMNNAQNNQGQDDPNSSPRKSPYHQAASSKVQGVVSASALTTVTQKDPKSSQPLPPTKVSTIPSSRGINSVTNMKEVVANAAAAAVPVQSASQIQNTTNQTTKSELETSLATQGRKISAFDILKNASKINSMTNSMIADQPEVKDRAPVTAEKLLKSERPAAAEPVTEPENKAASRLPRESGKELVQDEGGRRDRDEDPKNRERDSSVNSTQSNQKKRFIQRLISTEQQKENQSPTSPEKTQEPEPTPTKETNPPNALLSRIIANESGIGTSGSKTARGRANSVQGESETKLINNILAKDPSLGKKGGQATETSASAKELPSAHRPSSAQPTTKHRPAWQQLEEESEAEKPLDPDDYIKKYFDHSGKYGLVFIMHSGNFQILFNDLTKMMFQLHSE